MQSGFTEERQWSNEEVQKNLQGWGGRHIREGLRRIVGLEKVRVFSNTRHRLGRVRLQETNFKTRTQLPQ